MSNCVTPLDETARFLSLPSLPPSLPPYLLQLPQPVPVKKRPDVINPGQPQLLGQLHVLPPIAALPLQHHPLQERPFVQVALRGLPLALPDVEHVELGEA